MPRFKNVNWNIPGSVDGDGRSRAQGWDMVRLAVLMDIRDEMQEANRHLARIADTLGCRNFLTVPGTLRGIRALLQPPAPKRKVRRRRP